MICARLQQQSKIGFNKQTDFFTAIRAEAWLAGVIAPCLLAGAYTIVSVPAWAEEVDYTELDVEALLQIEVTSVSKKKQKIGEAPAAIHVIRQEDIRRSGATTIAEVLRMVPGLEVARINGHAWAVSSRGFNGYYASKLLVLVDGRSVYTPEFSGVYWDAVDTLLDDIERIEVIRGPGGALWGANAVNGVINIMTKNAADTQGGLVTAGGGNALEYFTALRYGGALNENTHYRVYAKTEQYDDFSKSVAEDGWKKTQAGFRVDGKQADKSQWTVQGDMYSSEQNEINWLSFAPGQAEIEGANLVGKWESQQSEYANIQILGYYDYYQRNILVNTLQTQTFDITFQHQLKLHPGHEFIWGVGYRSQWNEFEIRPSLSFIPEKRQDNLFSAFGQYDYQIIPDKLKFIVGSKIEHNDYSGWETQPNLRLLWTPTNQTSWWAAISRAIRAPSRAEHDSLTEVNALRIQNPFYPTPLTIRGTGSKLFESEVVMAYELGFRSQWTPTLSVDLAAFYNQYEKLTGSSFKVVPDLPNQRMLMLQQGGLNGVAADTYGVEIAAHWQIKPWWHLYAAITGLKMDIQPDPGVTFSSGHYPSYQYSLRSTMDLGAHWNLDLWLRRVDAITADNSSKKADGYAALDMRVAWKPRKNLEFSLVGQNLFDNHHYEFVTHNFNPLLGEVDRGVYAQVRWQF